MSLLTRIRNVFRPAELAREIDEELQFHVDMRARDYAAQGMPPDEARARALLAAVHTLARAYGWSEPDVLALSEQRRAAYLEMVTA